MKKIAVFIFILGIGFIVGCSEPNQAQTNEAQVKTVNVETQQVDLSDFNSYLRLVGSIEASNDVRLSAEASGQIIRYYVSEGEQVSKGERIAKIDDSQLKKEQQRLEAQTQQAKEAYERQKSIWESDSIGSEMDMLNAKYQYEQSKAALEAVNVQLSKTDVTAPFDAEVEHILAEEGEMVSPGVPLVRLISSRYVKITAGVPARYADVVTVNDSAEIWFDTQTSDTLTGAITFVGNAIDQQTRTFRIEIAMPDSTRKYKIGMIANIRLRTAHRHNAIVVGKEFIYQHNNEYVVYTVSKDEDGHLVARRKPVTMGPSYANNVVIEEGLQPEERLITVGSSFLNNGMRIQIVDNGRTS